MDFTVNLMIMSGAEDGTLLEYSPANNDGQYGKDKWTLKIGRRDDNDLILRNDTFVSRLHAKLHYMDERWWLEDCESTNGTFVERDESFFDDKRVKGIVPINESQLFRIGRTWLQIQLAE